MKERIESQIHTPMDEEELEQHIIELDRGVTQKEVVQFLTDLPSETHPKYHRQLGNAFRVENTEAIKTTAEQIMEVQSLNCEGRSEFVRFSAFYLATAYYRRNSNPNKMRELVEEYRDKYDDYIIFQFLESICLRIEEKEENYPKAITKAKEVADELSNNPDILHGYVHNVVHGLERNWVDEDDLETHTSEALDLIKIAINRQEDYAKYYATKAKILAERGEYESALKEIQQAERKEDKNLSDYSQRIAEYQTIRTQILTEQKRTQIEKISEELSDQVLSVQDDLESFENRVDQINARIIQSMAFFSGLITVILTVSMAGINSNFSIVQTAQFTSMLTGGLLIAFAGFGLMLPFEDSNTRSVIIFIMGIVLIVIGFGLVPAMLSF